MEPVTVELSDQITLTSGTLTYWPDAHPDQVRTLATGLSGAPGATLATFDTTVLANGSYILAARRHRRRESPAPEPGAGRSSPATTSLAACVVEITDFTVPIAGMPITVGRRYDSLEKDSVGDFGYGWSLVLGHPKLEVDQANNVTMTLPNGRRVTFNFAPTFPSVGPVSHRIPAVSRVRASAGRVRQR